MRSLSLIACGLIILALVVSGCTTTPSPAQVTPTPVPTIPAGSPIVGSWALESMVSAGTAVALVPGTTIAATFGPTGTFSGNDGCNSQSGTYTVSGSQIQVGPNLASTLMACPTQVMDQASTYTRILVSSATWQVSGDRLTIQDSRSGILVYVKKVPTPATTAPPVIMSPVGSWDLTSGTLIMAGGEGSAVVNPAAKIVAIFGTDGTVQGFAGCNEYSGKYTTSGSSIAVTDIFRSTKSCGNVLDTQERAYIGTLAAASTFENTGTTLTILTASTPPGKLVYKPGTATPSPVVTAIVDSWTLTTINKAGTSLTPVAGAVPTATFTADGNLTGNAGCNQYSGTYTVTGPDTITVGPLATTRMACETSVMDQETNYLGILQNAATWAYSDASGKLTIRDNTASANTLVYAKTP